MDTGFIKLPNNVSMEGDPVLGLSVLPSLTDSFDKLTNLLLKKGYRFNTELCEADLVRPYNIIVVLKGERRRDNCILCNRLGQWFLLDGNNIQEPRVAVQYRLDDSGLVSTIRVRKHWGPNCSEDYTPIVVFIPETVKST